MQLTLTPLLQDWGLPSQLPEGEPDLSPPTAGERPHASLRTVPCLVRGQGRGVVVLVSVRGAVADPFLCEAQSNWAARLGDGSADRDPFSVPALGTCSFAFPRRSAWPYIWGFLLCASRASRPPPPQRIPAQNTEGPKGPGWHLNHIPTSSVHIAAGIPLFPFQMESPGQLSDKSLPPN